MPAKVEKERVNAESWEANTYRRVWYTGWVAPGEGAEGVQRPDGIKTKMTFGAGRDVAQGGGWANTRRRDNPTMRVKVEKKKKKIPSCWGQTEIRKTSGGYRGDVGKKEGPEKGENHFPLKVKREKELCHRQAEEKYTEVSGRTQRAGRKEKIRKSGKGQVDKMPGERGQSHSNFSSGAARGEDTWGPACCNGADGGKKHKGSRGEAKRQGETPGGSEEGGQRECGLQARVEKEGMGGSFRKHCFHDERIRCSEWKKSTRL